MAVLKKARPAAKADASAAPEPNPRIVPGANNPPAEGSLEALRERYTALRDVAADWLSAGTITSADEANRLEAFRKQVRAFAGEADTARKAEKKVHDEAGKAVQAKWAPVLDSAERLMAAVQPLIDAWAKKERDRLAAEREAAAKEAEEKRRMAERAADRALEGGSLAAQDVAADLAREADEADKKAKAAANAKVSLGGDTVVNGVKRSGALRTFERVEVRDGIAALMHMTAHGAGVDEAVIAGVGTMVRAYRKAHPGEAIPGIVINIEERVV